MFVEQGVTPENKFWKYIVGSLVVILASVIGQIPLLIAVFVKVFSEGKEMPTNETEIMKILDSNLLLFLMLFSFAIAMVAIYMVIQYFHKQTFLSVTTSRSKVDWNRIFFSFSLWAFFTIISTAIAYYSAPENFEITFKPVPFLILFLISIVMIPIQTSTEEYVFRGYLMQGFANLSRNKWFPLIMTSVIFGSMHILNPEVTKMGYAVLVFYIGTGFVLGIMTLMDEGMELALGFHAANNLITALLVTSDYSALQTNAVLKDISDPTAGLDVILPVFVIYPILLFIMAKKYNWTNWKEKLTGKVAVTEDQILENE